MLPLPAGIYLDFNTHARMYYFESQGFPPSEFERLNIGPVVLTGQVEYRKELKHLDRFKITISLGGMNAKKDRFILAHRFINQAGDICVTSRSMFIFLDRVARKKMAPIPILVAAIQALPHDEVWEDL